MAVIIFIGGLLVELGFGALITWLIGWWVTQDRLWAMLSSFDVRLLGLRGRSCAAIWRDENGIVKYRHANDNEEQLADSLLEAYAAIKPNAAEEGTE